MARLEPRSSDLKFKVLTAQFLQAPCLHDYALTTIKPKMTLLLLAAKCMDSVGCTMGCLM